MQINYLCLHKDKQPDFIKLEERGWIHPLDFDNKSMPKTVVRDYKEFTVQIVQHDYHFHKEDLEKYGRTYTEVYVHPKGDSLKAQLKGQGNYFTPDGVYKLLKWLEEELNEPARVQ